MTAKLRRIRLPLLLAIVVGACAIGIQRSSAQEDDLDPVKLMPQYHKVVFENALVRVSEERMPPGIGIGKHHHQRGITINMADYSMEQKMYPGGEIVHSDRHQGEIHWNDAMTHETRNIGQTPQWVVRVEVKGGL